MQTSDQILDELIGQGIGRGRKKKLKSVRVSIERELTQEDVLRLAFDQKTTNVPSIQKIRNSHHFVARLLAEGRKSYEIGLITGYTPGRISQLARDPTFKELIAYYKANLSEVYVDVHRRLASFALDALEEIQSRLDEEPERFSNKELNEYMNAALDRSGYGPTSTTQVKGGVTVITDEILYKIKEEAERRRLGIVRTLSGPGEVIDSVPVQSSPNVSEEEESERSEGERIGLREEIHPDAGEGSS